ncbi:CHAP domain-containing protein [Staphylococcus lugdunensis]|uniref:glucosaminidase domain-containing protein n=1 Tax=Staphylococcus lugdunensis TaxID=28035 RepID=UPI001245D650|nr:glucosaminidase domain-containing protein [Staphylococcus lugdunensis]QEX32040.1 CHAP domain-containing protein [Staphylococcus lugdunensis]
MGLPNPKSRKPTASEVAAWAKSRIGKRLNVDGYYGSQCWDLPNYIFKRYWGFFTSGNAIAMAWYHYPKGFRFYRNTASFVPKPGDMAVWGKGSFNNGTGHTAVVVGPSTKSYFTSVDQNWYGANGYNGSPAAKVKHSYYGISGFVRPPYQPETKKTDSKPDNKPEPQPDNKPKNTKEETKPIIKEVKKLSYTSFLMNYDKELEYNYHHIAFGDFLNDLKGIYVKESQHMRSVQDIYAQRNKYLEENEYPHVFVDREMIWQCRPTDRVAPAHNGWFVIEVCGGQTDSKRQFLLNQLRAIVYGVDTLKYEKVELSNATITADKNIWRTMKDAIGYDLIVDGIPNNDKYEEIKKKIIAMYKNKDKLFVETIHSTSSKMKIKVNPKETSVDKSSHSKITPLKPKVVVEKSPYTFKQALDRQMAYGKPMKTTQWSGWVHATRQQTSNAMNPTRIWKSNVQHYQMLDLGRYQGISVDKLNKILKGKGTLAGQGKAFASACKKYNVNEIYLIAHAFLESGNGTSNYASGRYGIYNYFGIAAYDNNPNASIAYAKRKGWTTPAKGIAGGAKFVRSNFFNNGKQTLYRMRWNPKKPGTMQYATAIEWCQTQATTINSLYKKVGTTGKYFIQDKYK